MGYRVIIKNILMTLSKRQVWFVVGGELLTLFVTFALGANWAMTAMGWCGL